MMPAGELWRSQESVSCPYSPKCLERLYENSGYVSNRYPTKRRKRPHRTVFRCFVLQKSHHQGFSNYFSYSLGRGILRTSPFGDSRKLDFHFTEFSEVRIQGILGSCARPCNPSYLAALRDTARLIP